jgi:hypothetical protein
MDLRLFHPAEDPNIEYKTLDNLNSRTGLIACRLLEWIGWYTSDVKHRLLGHYRLFQLYKKHRFKTPASLSPVMGYILQYRASHWIKYYWYILISRLPSMWKHPDEGVEMYSLNKLLLYERVDVLVEFLENADADFEQAFKKALRQIHDPEFINTASIARSQHANLFVNLEQHTVNNHSHNELNIHPIVEKEKETVVEKETTIKEIIIKEPAKDLTGKEKGVFSKKQVLILFDLLVDSPPLERLPVGSPTKHQALAEFLQAVTGKGTDTWLEMLKDYQAGNLYTCHTPGERTNLIASLGSIAKAAHAAGLRSVASEAEKRIRHLRQQK